MNETTKNPRCAGVLAGLIALCIPGAAMAQVVPQEFEVRYTAAASGGTEFAPMPTVAIVPKASALISKELASQLTEAVDGARGQAADGDRFGAAARGSGAQVQWSFSALTHPRSANAALTEPYFGHLFACLHAFDVNDVDEGLEAAVVDQLMTGFAVLDEEELEAARSAGRTMLANWKADRCKTRRNDLPFFEQRKDNIRAATSGMLTDAFDLTIFNNQGLIDVVRALYPLFYHPGGLWATDRSDRLVTLFSAGVDSGLLNVREATAVATTEFASFWDFMLHVTASKPTVVPSFFSTLADRCVGSADDLSVPFQLQRCVQGGAVKLVKVRVRGADYVAVQAGAAGAGG